MPPQQNVFVDIVFRLQARAALEAEKLIAKLESKSRLATFALQNLQVPKDFPKNVLDAAKKLGEAREAADQLARANSEAFKTAALAPLRENLRLLDEASEKYRAQEEELRRYLNVVRVGQEISEDEFMTLTEGAEALRRKRDTIDEARQRYRMMIDDLEKGGTLLKRELESQRRLAAIARTTGLSFEELDYRLLSLSRTWDSLVPLGERIFKPTADQIQMLATGMYSLERSSAKNMVALTRNAIAAEALGEPMAYIDKSAYRLLKHLDPLNYQLARLGISEAITAELADKLAQGLVGVGEKGVIGVRKWADLNKRLPAGALQVSRATYEQLDAVTKYTAALDRLALPTTRQLDLGTQLYDIFNDLSRVQVRVSDVEGKHVKALDYHSRGIQRLNRSLRALNTDLQVDFDLLQNIHKKGWGALPPTIQANLKALRRQQSILERVGVSLDRTEKPIRNFVDSLDEISLRSRGLRDLNRALRESNIELEVNEDVLNRIREQGWKALTPAQREALESARQYYTKLKQAGISLKQNERAILDFANAIHEADRALHFKIRTADDAKTVLARLRRIGYEGLTKAEKAAIEEMRQSLKIPYTLDPALKRVGTRLVEAADSYKVMYEAARKSSRGSLIFLHAQAALRGGVARASRLIDRLSIGALKLLGPIFLVTAAFNTFSQVIGTSIRSFTDFQDALIGMRVAAGLTYEETNRIALALDSLSRYLPFTAAELGQVAAEVARAGIEGEQAITKLTNTITRFAYVSRMSLGDATNLILRMTKAFAIPAEQAYNFASTIHQLAIATTAESQDIAKALARVGAAASGLGVSADAIAAMSAVLIDAGMSAERAGTRLRAFLREFIRDSDDIIERLEEAGVQIEGYVDLHEALRKEPIQVLKAYLEYLYNMEDEVKRNRIIYEDFGSVAAFAIVTLVNHYPRLLELMEQANKEMLYGSSLTNAFTKSLDAMSYRLKIAQNNIDRIQRSLGALFAPAIKAAADAISGFAEAVVGSTDAYVVSSEGAQEFIDQMQAVQDAVHKTRGEINLFGATTIPVFPGENKLRKYTEAWDELARRNIGRISRYFTGVSSAADVMWGSFGVGIKILKESGLASEELLRREENLSSLEKTLSRVRMERMNLETKYTEEQRKSLGIQDDYLALRQYESQLEKEIARARLEVMDIAARDIDLAVKSGRVHGEQKAQLQDINSMYRYYRTTLNDVSREEFVIFSIISKSGPMWEALEKSLPTEALDGLSVSLAQAAMEGKTSGEIFNALPPIVKLLAQNLTLGAYGWEYMGESAETTDDILQGADRTLDSISDKLSEVRKETKMTGEEFLSFSEQVNNLFDSLFNLGDSFMDATEKKVEMDRVFGYTAPGIMMRNEFGKEIDELIELTNSYKEAIKNGDIHAATQYKQAIAAKKLALQQKVSNWVLDAGNPILSRIRANWAGALDTLWEWIDAETRGVPSAVNEANKAFAQLRPEEAARLPTFEELISQLTEKGMTVNIDANTQPAESKLATFIESLSGTKVEIPIVPVLESEVKRAYEEAGIKVPGFARGGYIREDTLAYLHKGEVVIPRQILESARRENDFSVIASFIKSRVPLFGESKFIKSLTESKVPHLQTGGYVKEGGFAVVHKGELIIPSELTEALKQGRVEEKKEVTIHIENLHVGRAQEFSRFIKELENYLV